MHGLLLFKKNSTMKKLTLSLLILLLFFSVAAFSQKVGIDGYVFEKYNRGFLNSVKITAFDKSGAVMGETGSDLDGHFLLDLPADGEFDIQFEKKVFITCIEKVSTLGKKAGEKVFVKREMERQPGYLLEVTLAEKRASADIPVDAVNGSRIEIYNNTTKKSELVIDSAQSPTFSHTLQQGNEYTILVRKNGFFNKRLHANVNINGCYLCMDGFGTVNPGVVSNLTSAENNKLGTLLSNVELERIDTFQSIVLRNIYYGYNSAEITEPSKKELDKVVMLLRTNPQLIIELGSHTDSRGSDEFNKKLSQVRAQAAVDYILASGWVEKEKLKARGYGEGKLVNYCDDGQPCNEDEHRENRRTELKIVGFTADAFEGKSLIEIIHEEELMAFVLNNESEKSYVGTGTQKTAAPMPTPISTPAAEANAIKTSSQTAQEVLKDNKLPVPKDKKAEGEVMKNQDAALSEDMVKTRPDTRPGEQADPQNRPKMESLEEPNTRQAEVSTSAQGVTINEKKIENPEKVRPIEGGVKINLSPVQKFTGYKVEIFSNPTPLSISDPDLQMIASDISPDIAFEKLPAGGTSYMVGTFLGWTETERYLEKIIAKYPKARIVEFYEGKRLGGN